MSNYAKFLKDILSKKIRFSEEGVVNLTATCSAIIQRSLPVKIHDPSPFHAQLGRLNLKGLCVIQEQPST